MQHLTYKLPARCLQLRARTEQERVVCHVKHFLVKSNIPRIFFKRTFFNKYRHKLINRFCQCHVALRTEGWTSAGVWIEQSNIAGAEGKAALFIFQIFDLMYEKGEICALGGRTRLASQCEQAKISSAI